MVFYPKVHQSKRVNGMWNLLGFLFAEDVERMNARMHEFGKRKDAGSVLKISGKGECN